MTINLFTQYFKNTNNVVYHNISGNLLASLDLANWIFDLWCIMIHDRII